jgi:hypothetical protein
MRAGPDRELFPGQPLALAEQRVDSGAASHQSDWCDGVIAPNRDRPEPASTLITPAIRD